MRKGSLLLRAGHTPFICTAYREIIKAVILMNMFTVQILQILLKSGNVRLQTLTDSLGLTRRMVLYYQKQLNDFLSKENLGSTFLQDDALFLASSDMQKIPEILETLDLNQYYLEASERQECICSKSASQANRSFWKPLQKSFMYRAAR